MSRAHRMDNRASSCISHHRVPIPILGLQISVVPCAHFPNRTPMGSSKAPARSIQDQLPSVAQSIWIGSLTRYELDWLSPDVTRTASLRRLSTVVLRSRPAGGKFGYHPMIRRSIQSCHRLCSVLRPAFFPLPTSRKFVWYHLQHSS